MPKDKIFFIDKGPASHTFQTFMLDIIFGLLHHLRHTNIYVKCSINNVVILNWFVYYFQCIGNEYFTNICH